MIIVAIIEAVSLVAVVFLLLREHAADKQAWIAERRELLTRIQRPEYVPNAPVSFDWTPDEEPDEFDMVGTIAEPKDES